MGASLSPRALVGGENGVAANSRDGGRRVRKRAQSGPNSSTSVLHVDDDITRIHGSRLAPCPTPGCQCTRKKATRRSRHGPSRCWSPFPVFRPAVCASSSPTRPASAGNAVCCSYASPSPPCSSPSPPSAKASAATTHGSLSSRASHLRSCTAATACAAYGTGRYPAGTTLQNGAVRCQSILDFRNILLIVRDSTERDWIQVGALQPCAPAASTHPAPITI